MSTNNKPKTLQQWYREIPWLKDEIYKPMDGKRIYGEYTLKPVNVRKGKVVYELIDNRKAAMQKAIDEVNRVNALLQKDFLADIGMEAAIKQTEKTAVGSNNKKYEVVEVGDHGDAGLDGDFLGGVASTLEEFGIHMHIIEEDPPQGSNSLRGVVITKEELTEKQARKLFVKDTGYEVDYDPDAI